MLTALLVAVFFTYGPAWDVAAGALIAEEAGARVTNIAGEADYLSPPQSVIACTPGIHARMLEELNSK